MAKKHSTKRVKKKHFGRFREKLDRWKKRFVQKGNGLKFKDESETQLAEEEKEEGKKKSGLNGRF